MTDIKKRSSCLGDLSGAIMAKHHSRRPGSNSQYHQVSAATEFLIGVAAIAGCFAGQRHHRRMVDLSSEVGGGGFGARKRRLRLCSNLSGGRNETHRK
ncbi:MAG: hypothetical protein WA858_14335 [Xanthobacteraceae bacterium]